jgi:hypothetical protein
MLTGMRQTGGRGRSMEIPQQRSRVSMGGRCLVRVNGESLCHLIHTFRGITRSKARRQMVVHSMWAISARLRYQASLAHSPLGRLSHLLRRVLWERIAGTMGQICISY